MKAILKVKAGTSNDLVYHELRRGDIISKIKDRQYKFFQKVSHLQDDGAVVKAIIEICKNNKMVKYYSNLHNHYYADDMAVRESRIHASENSLTKYYLDMMFVNKSCIYDPFINDELRGIISRWRLSNHDLKIELGRYSGIPREKRVCDTGSEIRHCTSQILKDSRQNFDANLENLTRFA